MSDSRKIESAETTEKLSQVGVGARNVPAPSPDQSLFGWTGRLTHRAPWVLIATSIVLWWILPQAWALVVLPWLSGALLTISGWYLHAVTREIGRRRYAVGSASVARVWVTGRSGAVSRLRTRLVQCRARRRLCVAGWVTRLAMIGGPVLSILLWLELAARPNLPLAGFVWALCVGGLALSLAVGELIREVLKEIDAAQR